MRSRFLYPFCRKEHDEHQDDEQNAKENEDGGINDFFLMQHDDSCFVAHDDISE